MGTARFRATGFRGGLGTALLSGVMGIMDLSSFDINVIDLSSFAGCSSSSSDSRTSPVL
jgi:hypothetical protein